MTHHADPHFGVDAQAIAIVHILAQSEFHPEDSQVSVQTYPWHTGPEHGICLALSCGHNEALYLAFGEDGRSPRLFLETWLGPPMVEVPNPSNFPNRRQNQRVSFSYGNVYEVAYEVYRTMEDYYKDPGKGRTSNENGTSKPKLAVVPDTK